MATSLPTLPALPSSLGLDNFDVQQGATDLGRLNEVANSPSGSIATPATPATPANVSNPSATTVSSLLGGFHLPSLEDTVFIVLGLILIAAGVFAFKSSQTIIETAGRFGARASEVAAA